MRRFTAVMALVVLCLSFTVSSKAEIVTDDRFYKEMNRLEGLDPKNYDSMLESRDAALADMKLLDGSAERVRQFKQANDRSYGLPSSVEELERMLSLTKAFIKDDVEEVQALSKSLLKKYKVSSLQELGVLAGKIINPGGSVSPIGLPSGHNFLEQDLKWVEEFLPQVKEALAKAKKEAKATDAKLSAPKELS
ncbi:MAG: hypothetical protein QNK28_10750 [Desulfobacterales bacterium]|nr:hypothetical protein [Desulfobacterales bacterium]